MKIQWLMGDNAEQCKAMPFLVLTLKCRLMEGSTEGLMEGSTEGLIEGFIEGFIDWGVD
jgi:hypothetical protein